jgi:hypothetical protein
MKRKLFDPIAVPPARWASRYLYCYCPACDDVVGTDKVASPPCPRCGRPRLKDIFTEMLDRLRQAWGFYERTRFQPGRWAFKFTPSDENYCLKTTVMALSSYAELRGMGVPPPWGPDEQVLKAWMAELDAHLDAANGNLNGPVCETFSGFGKPGGIVTLPRYLAGDYSLTLGRCVETGVLDANVSRYVHQAGRMTDEDHLRDPAAFDAYLKWRESAWRITPWGEGSLLTRVIQNHCNLRQAAGLPPDDDMVERAHRWLDEKQDPKTGAWGGEEATHEHIVNGMFKVLQSYQARNWPIRHMDRMTDYVLSATDPTKGFTGEGCSLFDPIMVLCVLRERGCAHRTDDVDEVAARTFLTFKDLWSDELGWYRSNNWNAKHNNAAPAHDLFFYHDNLLLKMAFSGMD